MKHQKEPEKILLRAIHIYWKVYYFILLTRLLIPILFITIWHFESQEYESTALWGTMTFLLLGCFILGISARPYRTIGNIVLSDRRIYFEGELAEFDNCDEIRLTLGKPLINSFLAKYFSFFQHGFGNSINVLINNQTLLEVNFFVRKRQEMDELVSKLKEIERTNKLKLEITKFEQPSFPNWNSFK
jgi:hypothetical protein